MVRVTAAVGAAPVHVLPRRGRRAADLRERAITLQLLDRHDEYRRGPGETIIADNGRALVGVVSVEHSALLVHGPCASPGDRAGHAAGIW